MGALMSIPAISALLYSGAATNFPHNPAWACPEDMGLSLREPDAGFPPCLCCMLQTIPPSLPCAGAVERRVFCACVGASSGSGCTASASALSACCQELSLPASSRLSRCMSGCPCIPKCPFSTPLRAQGSVFHVARPFVHPLWHNCQVSSRFLLCPSLQPSSMTCFRSPHLCLSAGSRTPKQCMLPVQQPFQPPATHPVHHLIHVPPPCPLPPCVSAPELAVLTPFFQHWQHLHSFPPQCPGGAASFASAPTAHCCLLSLLSSLPLVLCNVRLSVTERACTMTRRHACMHPSNTKVSTSSKGGQGGCSLPGLHGAGHSSLHARLGRSSCRPHVAGSILRGIARLCSRLLHPCLGCPQSSPGRAACLLPGRRDLFCHSVRLSQLGGCGGGGQGGGNAAMRSPLTIWGISAAAGLPCPQRAPGCAVSGVYS